MSVLSLAISVYIFQRFIPSEFGSEVDRITPVLPAFQACIDMKKLIRREVEKSGIPYTFVAANSFGAYFVNFLLRPYDKELGKFTIYGTGEKKCKPVFFCRFTANINMFDSKKL